MRLSWFVRPRSVPVPTLAGWAVLAALVAGGLAVAARALPAFLAVDEPVGHGLLVVEGWLPGAALDRAAEVARAGSYDAVVVTGGPILDPQLEGFSNYADRAGAYLRARGVGDRDLAIVRAPLATRDRTWEAARALRRWLDASGRHVSAVDVLSAGPHARRSRALFRRALGEGVVVGARAAPPGEYELARWWERSAGAKDVVGEALGWAWMACCFSPGSG